MKKSARKIEKVNRKIFKREFFRHVSSLRFLYFCGAVLILFSLCSIVSAQTKIAVLAPDKSDASRAFSAKLKEALARTDAKIFDDDLSAAAYEAQAPENPFNQTLLEAKRVGAAIGCDFFLLVKSATLRRESLSKGEYVESYAALYTVSARTGRLIFWRLASFEAKAEDGARAKLFASANISATEIADKIKQASEREKVEKPAAKFEELPTENSPEAKNFRPPLPYRRLRPAYTSQAGLYLIEATVDVEIDVDENGAIAAVEIARWAGYGLDEATAENVKKMNWRAATRDGKPLPTRVLLRYNFKKIEAAEKDN
jgi:TonB family protein